MNADRCERELVALFGREIVQRVQMTEAELHLTVARMEAVRDAADALLGLPGDIRAQQAVVANLDPITRLVLCMWVQDMELRSRLARQALHNLPIAPPC